MKKILFFVILLCILGNSSFAKPYIPASDSEGTLIILKKYRDIFNDKYGISLSKNSEIISEESDSDIKAKVFLSALKESGYSLDKTFNSLLDTYKVSFINHKRYKSYSKVLAVLFKSTAYFITNHPEIAIDEYDISPELRGKFDFYLNFNKYLRDLDLGIIQENTEEVQKIGSLMKKYGGNYLYSIRESILQYFGILGIPQDRKKSISYIRKIMELSKTQAYVGYEEKNALSAILLHDQMQQSGFTWSKANKVNSGAVTDVIAARYALLNSDLEVIDTLESLASGYGSNDFSAYVSNMILLEIESGNNFYQNFVSLRDKAKANLIQGWARKTALQLSLKNSLVGVIFYCVAPKDKELEELLSNSSLKQKEYTKKFENFLKSANSYSLNGSYKYNINKMARFKMKINSNNDTLFAIISDISPKIKKHTTIKAIGSINRRPFAFNALELDTKVSDFMYGRKMFLSLQPDGNLAGIDDSEDAKIKLKFKNLFLDYVSKGNIEEVKKLLDSGVDPNSSYYTERSAFAQAARNGHLEIVKLLFSKGININAVDIYGWSAIDFASEKGHTKIADFLIKNGSDVNNANITKNTSLMNATSRGYSKIVDLLLKSGANVNLQNDKGWTALLFACSYGNVHIVKKIIENGANLNLSSKNGWTPLMEAVQNKNYNIVNLLLNSGADVNALSKEKQSALVVAIESKDYNLVKLLIENGVEVPVVDRSRWSTLQFAVFHGTPDIVRLLLENGVNVNYERYGKSASLLAKNKSLLNMLTVLNKADEIQNSIHSLHAAALAGKTKNLETLLKSKINLDGKNESGVTALMTATQNGHTEFVKLLLAHGANGNIKDPHGNTALKIAIETGNKDIAVLLQNFKQPPSENTNNTAQTSQPKNTKKDTQASTAKLPVNPTAEENKLSEQVIKNTNTNPKQEAEKSTSQVSATSTAETSKREIQASTATQTVSSSATSPVVSTVKPTAPILKKPGKAVIIPTTTDTMSVTAFTPDQKPDSCIQVIALNKSPLTAVRLESLSGASVAWKTKDVKTEAQGVLSVMKDGKIINTANASFTLDVAKETPLSLCVQDTGVISDSKTRMRIIFFHQDGSRRYAIIER